jgi:protein SCO1/2
LTESPHGESNTASTLPGNRGRSVPWIPLLVALAALGAGLAAGLALRWDRIPAPQMAQDGAVIRGPFSIGGEFELIDHRGEVLRLSDLRGHPVLLFFGYTHCPDVCPTTLADMRLALNRVGERAGGVRVALVSVDPERDTPQSLREYVGHFGPQFLGLTGSEEAIASVARQYGAVYEIGPRDPDGNYSVGHSAFIYLIDGEGVLRVMFPFGTSWERVAEELGALL